MEFVLIPAGKFYMGNADTLSADSLHLVTITRDFWLAETEVTQEQWEKVMGDTVLHPEKPSPFSFDNQQYPVVSVSWYDIQIFLQKLDSLSPGIHFRLPTEAEWEYACRAGTNTAFSMGDSIADSLANYNAEIESSYSKSGGYIGHPEEVRSFPPNQWGLYDMHGNAWEWTTGWYAPYSSVQAIDPLGPKEGVYKVIRGGSWYFGADNATSFFRKTHKPEWWGFSIGFRVVAEKK